MSFLIYFFAVLYPFVCFSQHSEVLDHTRKYLLPEDHPIKAELDQFFKKSRFIASYEALDRAGFIFDKSLPHKITVAKHPCLEGYLIKTYLDNSLGIQKEWRLLVRRIHGAIKIGETINKYGFAKIMKVPQKWIYIIPEQSNLGGYNRRKCLLIVEDMNILSPIKNALHYRTQMTKSILRALYTVITENLLLDCVYIRNIPVCKDGKIAFIDTEPFIAPKEKICYGCLAEYLSPKMQVFWERLFNLE